MVDTRRLLELALKGLQSDRERIDNEITQIKRQLNGDRVIAVGPPLESEGPKRRTMSARARKRISEGMKRRHAALRAAAQAPHQEKQTGAVGLTAAGRRKLSEMMKARWAAKRKAAKKAA